MTEEHGLSREQVEARLADRLADTWLPGVTLVQRSRFAKILTPTVAAMLADAWPCANYRQPTTCLTAPSSETGRCDWCRTQAEAAEKRGEDRGRAEGWDAGARQASTWLRADYEYGTGPDWREDGAAWIEDRLAEHNAALARHTATAAQEGTTEPLGVSGGSATCGERHGDMRCQLRRGHDGACEDYSAVAQDRRA